MQLTRKSISVESLTPEIETMTVSFEAHAEHIELDVQVNEMLKAGEGLDAALARAKERAMQLLTSVVEGR